MSVHTTRNNRGQFAKRSNPDEWPRVVFDHQDTSMPKPPRLAVDDWSTAHLPPPATFSIGLGEGARRARRNRIARNVARAIIGTAAIAGLAWATFALHPDHASEALCGIQAMAECK